MYKNNYLKFFFTFIIFFFLIYLIYGYFFKSKKIEKIKKSEEESIYNLNIIKDVKYNTKDNDGNEYIINALQGEIEYSNPNIIFLTKVNALIYLKNSAQITIVSDYGKYNSKNLDTIFSKNVIINYLDNKITSDYVDFSLKDNLMIISKDVVYENLENVLRADVLEMNIKTKDSKIFMYEDDQKVNVRSLN